MNVYDAEDTRLLLGSVFVIKIFHDTDGTPLLSIKAVSAVTVKAAHAKVVRRCASKLLGTQADTTDTADATDTTDPA